MKKLLFGASLLIIGAKAYSGVAAELTPDSDGKYGARVVMPIVSIGEIVDASGRFLLVLEPKVNAGPDGTSLMFDHGQVIMGRKNEMMGKFEAMVITGGVNLKDNYSIVPLTEDGILTELFHGKNTPEEMGKYSEPQPLHLMDAPENNSYDSTDSTLTYQLTKESGLQGNIYKGVVLSKVEAGDIPGTFIDRKGKLSVTVKGIDHKYMKVTPIDNKDKK